MKKRKISDPSVISLEEVKLETHTVLCISCKEAIIFINGQDSKLCPSCGTSNQNVKS